MPTIVNTTKAIKSPVIGELEDAGETVGISTVVAGCAMTVAVVTEELEERTSVVIVVISVLVFVVRGEESDDIAGGMKTVPVDVDVVVENAK